MLKNLIFLESISSTPLTCSFQTTMASRLHKLFFMPLRHLLCGLRHSENFLKKVSIERISGPKRTFLIIYIIINPCKLRELPVCRKSAVFIFRIFGCPQKKNYPVSYWMIPQLHYSNLCTFRFWFFALRVVTVLWTS